MHGAGDERKEARVALPDHDMMAAIAATRFGLGAKAGEIDAARGDPKGFLKSQIRASGADQPAGATDTAGQRLTAFREAREERREVRAERVAETRNDGSLPAVQADANMAAQAAPPDRRADAAVLRQQQVGRVVRDDIAGDFTARVQLGATTEAAFRERWANFWANHFTVSATKQITATIIGPFEAEAIRPHVFGRFLDLLGAVETHPAMLTYLDQIQSIGPHSEA